MLTITRPTPTTVLFTLSTASSSKTLAAQASKLVLILLRIAGGLVILTGLLAEAQAAPSISRWLPTLLRLPDAAQSSRSATLLVVACAQQLAAYVGPLHIAARLALHVSLVWLVLRRGYTEESLLVVRGLGVQTTTSSGHYFRTGMTRFIPTAAVQDLFIHEAFVGFQVRYYMAIVVEGEKEVVVVFPVRETTSPAANSLESS